MRMQPARATNTMTPTRLRLAAIIHRLERRWVVARGTNSALAERLKRRIVRLTHSYLAARED